MTRKRLKMVSCVFFAVSSMTLAYGEENLVARATADSGDQTYRLDVLNIGPMQRAIEIQCVDGCKGSVAYRSTMTFSLIYAMQPSDVTPYFITLWSTGSAERLIVYALSSKGIKKDLEIGVRRPPLVAMDESGKISIEACEGKTCRRYVETKSGFALTK